MKKLGFVVNPIAGMGGSVGLKGTDGEEILRKAIELGATPVAPGRAVDFLKNLKPAEEIHLITYPMEMGEYEAKEAGFRPTVIGKISKPTTASDTKRAVREMCELGVDLLVFCGGDGTARDVLDAIKPGTPSLGVPAGVKMYSAVFARTPEIAAHVAIRYLKGELPLKEAEVADIDEEAFRAGRLSAKIYGYMLIPYEPKLVQSSKIPTPSSESELKNQMDIARWVVENMDEDVIYILGPGTTVAVIAKVLNIDKTILGVDLVKGRKLLLKDANEKQILDAVRGRKAKIILSPLGGLGSLLGRGNQQISPKVIKAVGKENIIVVATKRKLRELPFGCLWVDTGDKELDDEFHGYMRVIVGYGEEELIKVM
ncbi:MAG: ATP-NAD kinase [Thermoprotei archaeon]|nr:MAG: ATP-NAD kinase [Thermoprotei archaeon]